MRSPRSYRAPPLTSTPRRNIVDSAVLDKVLEINPALGNGQSRRAIKQRLEGTSPSPVDERLAPVRDLTVLRQAITTFMQSKADELRGQLEDLDRERQAIDERAASLRRQVRDQLTGFIGFLDADALANCGHHTLNENRELLELVGATPDELLAGR